MFRLEWLTICWFCIYEQENGEWPADIEIMEELGYLELKMSTKRKWQFDLSESEISAKYGITSIPTLLFFKNGEIVDKHVGSASKSQLEDKLNSII